MTSTLTPSRLHCRTCGDPIDYSGVGRMPTTCSAECRRAARAEDARARQSAPPAAPDDREMSPREAYIIAGLRQNARERSDAHEHLRGQLATPQDFYPSSTGDEEVVPLRELSLDTVRPSRSGATVWASDASLAAQRRHAAREADTIRAACVKDAEREAQRRGRLLSVADAEALRAELLARADERADGIIAALATA